MTINIPQDKKLHFMAGMLVTMAVSWSSYPIALIVLLLVAAGKEIMDSRDPENHTADIWDFIVTLFGGLVGITIHWFLLG